MIVSPSDLELMYRLYLAWYRLEHDRSPWGGRSFWGLEIALSPPRALHALSLENLLVPEAGWVEREGRHLRREGLRPVDQPPELESWLSFVPRAADLKETRLEAQMLIAPEDADYDSRFDRDQAWEWLMGSDQLTELMLVGKVSGGNLELIKLFHSCYQTDQNRDLTEELRQGLALWKEVRSQAEAASGQALREAPETSRPGQPPPSPYRPYRLFFPEELEAARLVELCRRLQIVKFRHLERKDERILTDLTPEEVADLLSWLRLARTEGLFQPA